MERQLLEALYQLLPTLQSPKAPRVRHSDAWIVLTYMWSVIWERPISWACNPDNWPRDFVCGEPSSSTMSRRLRTPSTLQLVVRAFLYLQMSLPQSDRRYIDAKPLCVGGSSGDRDATIGWAAGRLAKGYKSHVIMQSTGRIDALVVMPLNYNDTSMGPALLEQIPMARGYLVGDTAYDAQKLYNMAAIRGMQLVATPRVAHKGLGHQRHSPHRLQGLRIAKSPEGQAMLRERFCIDRHFGYWGNIPGGLWGLPNFVRHLDRVRLWVVAKLIVITLRGQLKTNDLRRR